MRRIYLALALVTFSAVEVKAQEAKSPVMGGVTLTEPKPVRVIVEVLAEDLGYKVEGLENIPESLTWKGRLEVTTLDEVLPEVMEPHGLEAIVDDNKKVVIIRRRKSGTANAQPRPMSTPAPPSQPQQGSGDVVLVDGSIVDRATIEQLRRMYGDRYVAETIATENARRTRNFGNYGGYANPAYGTYGGYGPYEAEAWRRFFITGDEGAMKTKGDTKGVALYARGCYIGDADQLDSWYNQKSAQYAGQAVKIMAVKDGRGFHRTVRFPSEAQARAVGMQHLTFTIHDDYFKGSGSYAFSQRAADAECRASLR